MKNITISEEYLKLYNNELESLLNRRNILEILSKHCDKIIILKPRIEGRDVDILLLNCRDITKLLDELKKIENIKIRYNNIDRISIQDGELEIDIYLSISWLGLKILDIEDIEKNIIPIENRYRIYILNPTMQIFLLFIHSLIHMRLNIDELVIIYKILRENCVDKSEISRLSQKYKLEYLVKYYTGILRGKIPKGLFKSREVILPVGILLRFLINNILPSKSSKSTKYIYFRRVIKATLLSILNSVKNLRGLIVVFEGIDASGKTTQSKMLLKKLRKFGFKVTYVHLEEHNPLIRFKEYFRRFLRISRSSVGLVSRVESCSPSSGKYSNVSFRLLLRVVSTILYRLIFSFYVYFTSIMYDFVIVDRYVYESLIGLFIRGLSLVHIYKIYSRFFIKPDIVILLDVDPRVSYNRRSDVHVYPIEFYMRYRIYLLKFSKLFNFKVVDSSCSIDVTFNQILNTLSHSFPIFRLLKLLS